MFEASDGTRVNYTSRNGAEFVISKDTHAPTLATSKYLFFGRVEIEVHAAEGTGIVTSLALTSDILDEVRTLRRSAPPVSYQLFDIDAILLLTCSLRR